MNKSGSGAHFATLIFKMLVIAALYYLSARIGFLLALPPGNVTALWFPSGLALGAVLVWGWQVTPGIFIGSLFANLGTMSAPVALPVSAAIAAGSTVQAWLTAFVMQRYVGPLPPETVLQTVRAVGITFVTTLLAPLVGVSSLLLAGLTGWDNYFGLYLTWWFGDLTGILVLTPLLVLAWQRWQRREVKESLLWLLTSLFIGVALFSFLLLRTIDQQQSVIEFQRDVTESATFIDHMIAHEVRDIISFSAHYRTIDLIDQIDQNDFQTFAKVLMANSPAKATLEWLPHVRQADRAAFEQEVRGQGSPNFKIFEKDDALNNIPAAERREYFPVRFLQPFNANEDYLGYDFGSRAETLVAILRARDSGLTAATGPIQRLQETGGQPGMLIVGPVYRNDAPIGTIEERRAGLLGVLVGVYPLDSLVKTTLANVQNHDVELYLYDLEDPQNPHFVAFYPSISGRQELPAADVPSPKDLQYGLFHTIKMDIVDRTWLLVARPGPDYLPVSKSLFHLAVLLVGFSLAGGFLFYVNKRQRAELALARSEAEFRDLSDNALTGILRLRHSGEIVYANQALAQFVGVDSPDELRHVNVQSFFADPKVYDAITTGLNNAPQLRNQELEIRTRQGEIRHVLFSATRVKNMTSVTVVDITERVRAQAELRQLSGVVAQMPDLVMITDGTGKIEYINPAFEQVTGYSADEVIGRTPSFLKSGLQPEGFYHLLWTTILSGNVFEGELVNRKKNGELFYEIKTITPTFDQHGTITNFIATSKDISERRQAALLQETVYRIAEDANNSESLQDLYKQIHRRIADVMDANNFYITLHDPATDMMSYVYSEDEMDPWDATPFPIGDGLTALVFRSAQTLLCDPKKTEELRAAGVYTPSGTPCQVWLGVPLILHGRTFGVMAVQDYHNPLAYTEREQRILEFVSSQVATAIDRKQTEDAVRLVERRNAALIQHAPDGIALVDDSGCFTFGSPSAYRLFGYTPAEILGTRSIDIVHPDDAPEVYATFMALLADPSRVFQLQYRLRHKNGDYRWLESTLSNLLDEPGVNAVVNNFHDVTERKLAEENLRISQARLELALEGTNAGLWDWIIPTGELIINRLWAEMLGYTLAELEPVSIKTWEDLCHPDDLKKDSEQLELHFSGKTLFYETETRMKHKDGHWVWIMNSGRVTDWDSEGKPVRMTGTHIDFSERKEASDMLFKSQASLESAQAVAHLGSWEQEEPDARATWSKEMFRLFERDPLEPVPDKSEWLELIHPDDRDSLRLAEQIALETGETISYIFRLPRAQNQMRYYESRIQVEKDEHGKMLRMSGTILDVTERKLMEMEVRERVKELTCLFTISRLLEDNSSSDEFVCQQIVDTIVPAMQYPQLTASLMELDGKKYSSERYSDELTCCISSEIMVAGEVRGRLTVYYTREEAFIIPEERDLIENITRMYGLWLERRLSERALRESNERFSQLAQNIQEVFWMYDLVNHKVSYISQAYELVWGRSCESLYQNPREYMDSILEEDRPVMIAGLEKQARGERTEMEYRVQRPDGSIRWVWDRSFPVWAVDGSLVRTAGVSTDITELKLAQQELLNLNRDLEKRVDERTAEVRQSEATYRALFENSNDGIFIMSPEGVELRANRRALEMLGYTSEEWGAISNDLLIPADEKKDADDRFAQALHGENTPLYERTFIRKDGTAVNVEINLSPVKDGSGRVTLVQSVVRDITERKQAEEILRESEARYRRAISAAGAVPYSMDYTTMRYTFMGEGFEQLTGYTREEITPLLFKSIIQEVQMRGVSVKMSEVENTWQDEWREMQQSAVLGMDYRILKKNGETRWLSDASVQVYDDNGQAIGAIGILQDISERKEAEETLRESRDKLREANETLANASRMKDEFLASMSHELRTPLTGILGLAEALQMQSHGSLNEKQLKAMRNIEKSGRHLLELINDILDLSKIEAGKLDMHMENFSVADVCQSSLQLVKGMAQQKHHNISFSMNLPIIKIQADSRRLKQMLVNLLSNAIKFTPDSGQIGLDVEADPEQKVIRFHVWDKGIGIRDEDLKKLFKSFVQLDSSLARQHAGTGLGLALVQRMADLHGGRVEVESVFGEGSRFTIVLPWADEDAANQPESDLDENFPVRNAPAASEGSSAGANDAPPYIPLVVVVDDNEIILETTGDFLKTCGYRVLTIPSGIEFLERAAEIKPDMILMDIQMPGLDGMETMRRLRAHKNAEIASTPVIAITALAMSGDRERCIAAGANEYMSKPIVLKQLVRVIERLLARQAQAR